VTADALPQTAIGHRVVSDELVKQQKKASVALLVVGILQITCGAVLLTILSRAAPGQIGPMIFVIQFGLGGIFLGLYFWARKSPLPATIVGFILYTTLVVINVVTSVTQMAQHPDTPRTGIGGLGIGWLDIVIMAILAQAIGAGLKYKRLLQAQGGGFPVAAAPIPASPVMAAPIPPPPPTARGV
jgi:hypothetical protein